jgi:hypothetical protein
LISIILPFARHEGESDSFVTQNQLFGFGRTGTGFDTKRLHLP